MQLTQRDLDLLHTIAAYRLLTRSQLQRLHFSPSGTTACKRRLTLLFHNGLVGRLALPLRNAYGATRAVYFVERAGRRALAAAEGTTIDVVAPPRGPEGEFFLAHALDVADVRIAFELAGHDLGYEVGWTHESDLRRAGVRVRIAGEPRQSTIPDGLLTITADGITDMFAVEVDRGTVSHARMQARFVSYGRWAARADLPSAITGDSFRVLTVVTAGRERRRLERLKADCEAVGGRSLFWFAELPLAGTNIMSTPVWLVAGAPGRQSLALRGVP